MTPELARARAFTWCQEDVDEELDGVWPDPAPEPGVEWDALLQAAVEALTSEAPPMRVTVREVTTDRHLRRLELLDEQGAWTWMVPGYASFLPPRPHDEHDDRLMQERMDLVAEVWGRAVASDDDHHEILWTWGC